MNFIELRHNLETLPTLAACASYLRDNALALRTLFYDGALGDGFENLNQKFEAEEALLGLINGPCGDEMRAGRQPPPEVQALLIYFISLFERTELHQLVARIVHKLPSSPLRARASAMYEYKAISVASVDYITRFKNITADLHSVWSVGSLQQKAQCEELAVEYFCSAAAPDGGIGERNRVTLQALFTAEENRRLFPYLASPRLTSILGLSREQLAQERADANARIAEAYYDEAAFLLPLPRHDVDAAICEQSGLSHDWHCPPGFHAARQALAHRFPVEFQNTNYFVKQSLTAAAYIDFTGTTTCMRYFRQYMPLHMPQIEEAVLLTLQAEPFFRRRIHVVDLGGGPGTLYVILASILSRGLSNHAFDVSLIEPSADFHTFLDVIARHVTHPNLTLKGMHACVLDDAPSALTAPDADWFFVGNVITPMVRGAGRVAEAVDRLCDVISATRRKFSPCVLTICENTNSVDFNAFCTSLTARGLVVTCREMYCSGGWLAGCDYYVSPKMLTSPYLKYALVRFPAEENPT